MQDTQAIRGIPSSTHSAQPDSTLVLTRTSYYLFIAFVAYLVLPLFDIPLVNLSPSAVLIGLVALEVFFRHKDRGLQQFTGWFVLAYFMWLAFVVSIVGNALTGAISPSMSDVLNLLRMTFWLITFLATMLIMSRISLGQLRRIMMVIGLCALLLGAMRLYEGVAFARWGAGSSAILTQNTYGILFSTFTPFAVALPFMLKGWFGRVSVFGITLLLVAIIVNGSRSAWIVVSLGLLIFTLLYILTQPKRVGKIIGLGLGLITMALFFLAVMPIEIIETVSDRFVTLESVEDDKSVGIREAMVQKGLELFERSPLIGVGSGYFTRTYIEFDVPDVVSYASLNSLNRRSSHNSYVRLLAETGVVGALVFAVFLIALLVRGAQSALRLASKDQVWAIAVFAGFIGLTIHLWTIDSLSNTSTWFIYGLVAAMIVRTPALAADGAQI